MRLVNHFTPPGGLKCTIPKIKDIVARPQIDAREGNGPKYYLIVMGLDADSSTGESFSESNMSHKLHLNQTPPPLIFKP